eukprot:CAMPEP_0174271104 /NCGR_PEP_ID=MMETSP0439-20130205/46778_1 /TAXON_ID=0 /ORGANISM="Stereomyxa ramosa, Strain Chinc5" /LENGTH=305 /DNA_ID=CAMNT_0015360879 /DNA_START=96 /DNA_END=1010 /DNA_ORIENTATION=-
MTEKQNVKKVLQDSRTAEMLTFVFLGPKPSSKVRVHLDWPVDHFLSLIHHPVRILWEDVLDNLTSPLLSSPSASLRRSPILLMVTHKSHTAADHYIDLLRGSGFHTIGCLHTGDIRNDHVKTWYTKCQFVYRHHWFEDKHSWGPKEFVQRVVRYLPLGSITLGSIDITQNIHHIIPASERQHLCNFMGTIHRERAKFYEALSSLGLLPNSTDKWDLIIPDDNSSCVSFFGKYASPKNVAPHVYRTIIADSTFTFAPTGTGPDSFRFYEALELGSIPILSKYKAHHEVFGDFPVPSYPMNKWVGVK